MGTYPLSTRIKLENHLKAQSVLKKLVKKNKKSVVKHPEMLSPRQVALRFNVPEKYVRRFAWERRLDCFPGAQQLNDMWMAGYLVVYLGYSCKQAAAKTGFKEQSVGNYVRSQGYKQYRIWGKPKLKNRQQRFLIIPRNLADVFTVRTATHGLEDLYGAKDWRKIAKAVRLKR